MAHDPLHTCQPQSIYGPFEQTQFLGLSVLSFTVNAGLNEQSSEITVELVRDLCITEKRFFKTSNVPIERLSHVEADPGFTNPVVGAPCYFRVAGFEYCGILQSWTQKKGADGNAVYTVKLTDPRTILDNIQIIVSEYQGKIKGISPDPTIAPVFPNLQLSNIINAYGFLDSINANCPLVDSAGNPAVFGDMNDPVYFGAPAGGWGISLGNQAGLPWNYLKRAIQVLIGYGSPQGDAFGDLPNGNPEMASSFSKGYISGPPGGAQGYGEIFTGGIPYSATSNPAKYILDLSEIPDAPDYYRISGPVITASELISQVCRDAGADYYIELLPMVTGQLLIKVRVIMRQNQPALGEINTFINSAAISLGTTSNTIGQEYRPNPNNAFVIGDKKRSVYRHSGTGHYHNQSIQPYWGRDLEGKLNPSYQSTCESINPADPNHWLGPADWNVRLDFREVNGLLRHSLQEQTSPVGLPYQAWKKLNSKGQGWVWEGELRAALGNYKDFINFLLQHNPYCHYDCEITKDIKDCTVLRLWAKDILLGFQGAVGVPPGGMGIVEVFLKAINVQVGTSGPKGPGSDFLRDGQRVHQWLQRFAQEHYGRKWLVEIPFACHAGDTGNPNLLLWSDEPSTEGAWSDAERIIELENSPRHGMAIDRFKSDDGRILPILRWTQNAPQASPICGRNPCVTGLDYDEVPMANMVTDLFNVQVTQGPDMYVWQKAEIENTWVTGSPYVGSHQDRAFALLTCDPVTTGFPVNDGKRSVDSFVVRSGLRDRPRQMSGLPMVALNGTYASRMLSPLAAVVPVLSNTQTYGPWWKQATMANSTDSYGTVFAEQDTSLSPWEYGGTEFMNVGALTKLENSTTSMNIAERGEVTVPGYPTKAIGAAIATTQVLYPARTLSSDSFFGYNYHYLNLGKSTSGASIANINVVVSPQGVTTSYTLSTFTPVFGRFSKGNAERIKEIGRNRLRNNKARRKLSVRSAHQKLVEGGGASNRAKTLLSSLLAGPAYSPNSAGVLLAGRLLNYDQKRKSVIVADKNTFAFYDDYTNTAMMSIDGLLRPVAKTGALTPGIFHRQGGGLPAMKSFVDTICPYTGLEGTAAVVDTGAIGTTGSGGTPYSGFPTGVLTVKNLYSPIAPPPPIPRASGIVIAANYLDPLADYGSNPTFMTGVRATGALASGTPYASGHDIESVARGDLSGLGRLGNARWTGESMVIAGESGRYTASTTDNMGLPQESGSGDYRFMALRGPLVLHSWGYDTYGKPIPNSKGYSGDVSFNTGVPQSLQVADTGNTHQRTQDGLTNRFTPNWLSDATNWPVAPVDLRYDRARGVWTSPPPFRLMKVRAMGSIAAGETGLVEVLTGGDIYDENGLAFSGITHATGSGADGLLYGTGVPQVISLAHEANIDSGSVLITHYDTYSCEHWVIGSGGGGGDGGGGGGGGCGGVTSGFEVVSSFQCIGDVITADTRVLQFNDGCLTEIL